MVFNAETIPVHRPAAALRHDWTQDEVLALFQLPFNDLLFQAQEVHRAHFDPNEVQISTLLSIKTGACPEDCAYCPQSARFDTGVKAETLMAPDAVLAEARKAKAAGATRFCMGAAWRAPRTTRSNTSPSWWLWSRSSASRPAQRLACSPAPRPVA